MSYLIILKNPCSSVRCNLLSLDAVARSALVQKFVLPFFFIRPIKIR